MKLVEDDNLFYFVDDYTSLGAKVRIFSYHVASYTEWCKPDALEARGIMFQIEEDGTPIKILSRPMEKFFNLNETPFTMNLDLSKIMFYMTKEDGSLISTYMNEDYVSLKSKASIKSEQVIDASEWLNKHETFKNALLDVTKQGYTVNMEWTSPKNRIVLSYEKSKLVVLNVRHNETGEYLSLADIRQISGFNGYVVEFFNAEADPEEWIKEMRKMQGIEGYVVIMPDVIFKLKTDWYCTLHHTKDSINSNRRLWEVCAEAATDDIIALFEGDQVAINRIKEFDKIYADLFSESLKLITSTYKTNLGLNRKDFAISAQNITKDLDKKYLFSIIMNTYQGLDYEKVCNQIKDVLVKYWKKFVPDDEIEE